MQFVTHTRLQISIPRTFLSMSGIIEKLVINRTTIGCICFTLLTNVRRRKSTVLVLQESTVGMTRDVTGVVEETSTGLGSLSMLSA